MVFNIKPEKRSEHCSCSRQKLTIHRRTSSFINPEEPSHVSGILRLQVLQCAMRHRPAPYFAKWKDTQILRWRMSCPGVLPIKCGSEWTVTLSNKPERLRKSNTLRDDYPLPSVRTYICTHCNNSGRNEECTCLGGKFTTRWTWDVSAITFHCDISG